MSRAKRLGFPKRARIVASEDFGIMLRSEDPRTIRLGRDCVSLCAMPRGEDGGVRFGFTVGKKHAHRSVDRALVKRILRESARVRFPSVRDLVSGSGTGLDVGLRLRASLGDIGRDLPVAEAKARVRKAADKCLDALEKRLKARQASS